MMSYSQIKALKIFTASLFAELFSLSCLSFIKPLSHHADIGIVRIILFILFIIFFCFISFSQFAVKSHERNQYFFVVWMFLYGLLKNFDRFARSARAVQGDGVDICVTGIIGIKPR